MFHYSRYFQQLLRWCDRLADFDVINLKVNWLGHCLLTLLQWHLEIKIFWSIASISFLEPKSFSTWYLEQTIVLHLTRCFMLVLLTYSDIESNQGLRKSKRSYNSSKCDWSLNSVFACNFLELSTLQPYKCKRQVWCYMSIWNALRFNCKRWSLHKVIYSEYIQLNYYNIRGSDKPACQKSDGAIYIQEYPPAHPIRLRYHQKNHPVISVYIKNLKGYVVMVYRWLSQILEESDSFN